MTDKVCADPSAPIVACCICGKPVHTCGSEEPIDGPDGWDYSCPVHDDGDQLSNGNWVCSAECWDMAAVREDKRLRRKKIIRRWLYSVCVVFLVFSLLIGVNVASWLILPLAVPIIFLFSWIISRMENDLEETKMDNCCNKDRR